MASNVSTANNSAKSSTKPGRLPPEEKFWKRYSPHHELPLSTASSVLIHAIALTVLIVGSVLLAKYGFGENKVEVGVLDIPGGTGGQPGGVEGPATGVEQKEDVRQSAPADEEVKPATPKPEELKDVNKTPAPVIESVKDPGRVIEEPGAYSQEFAKAREAIAQQVAAATGFASKGQGGSGEGGGKGGGVGTGEGDNRGPGKGKIQQRKTRQQRWVMIFNTRDGDDYTKQLQSLKAILAVPVPDEKDQYLVIEDLSQRPVQPKKKDLQEIKRIYWIDDKPESVASLSRALGLNPVPSFIVAFFPEELEQELLEKELKYRRLDEDRIEETRFQVRRKGGGYEPVVVEQHTKEQGSSRRR
jgi:hypothetical protein